MERPGKRDSKEGNGLIRCKRNVETKKTEEKVVTRCKERDRKLRDWGQRDRQTKTKTDGKQMRKGLKFVSSLNIH